MRFLWLHTVTVASQASRYRGMQAEVSRNHTPPGLNCYVNTRHSQTFNLPWKAFRQDCAHLGETENGFDIILRSILSFYLSRHFILRRRGNFNMAIIEKKNPCEITSYRKRNKNRETNILHIISVSIGLNAYTNFSKSDRSKTVHWVCFCWAVSIYMKNLWDKYLLYVTAEKLN